MSRIFWDSNLFIYLIEDYSELGARVAALRKRMLERCDLLYTSALTVGEVLLFGQLGARHHQDERKAVFLVEGRDGGAVLNSFVLDDDGAADLIGVLVALDDREGFYRGVGDDDVEPVPVVEHQHEELGQGILGLSRLLDDQGALLEGIGFRVFHLVRVVY